MPWWVSTTWLLQISQFPHGFLCNLSIHSDHLASDCECLPSLHYQLSCLLSFILRRGSLCLIMSLCSGLLIQVDISGHPPFATVSKQFFGNFGNLLFLVVFQVLNFWSHFEALNDVFWENKEKHWSYLDVSPKMNLLDDTFRMGYHAPKTKTVWKRYDPGKLMY